VALIKNNSGQFNLTISVLNNHLRWSWTYCVATKETGNGCILYSTEQRFIFNWTNCKFPKSYLWHASLLCIVVGSLNPNLTPKSWSHFTTLTWSGVRPVYRMITSRSLTCVASPRLGQRTWDHQTSLMDTAVTWWPSLSQPVVGKLEWSSDQTGLLQAKDSTPLIWLFVACVSCRLFKIHWQIHR